MVQRASATALGDRLFARFAQLRHDRPDLRAAAYARLLAVSEAELVAARATAGEAVALAADPRRILAAVPSLGPVTARSRSRDAVLACHGVYGAPDIGEHTGIVIGENIDLRIFPSGWKFAYAVHDDAESGPRRSLQIFDGNGTAAHTIDLRPQRSSG